VANIKAGVAYVDIRLGSAKPLTDAIEAEVVKAGDTASKAAGKKITENLTKTTTAKPAAARIVSDFQFARARVTNALAPIGNAIAKPFMAAWNGVTTAWNKASSAIQTGIRSIGNRIQTTFPRAFQAAVGAVNKFKSALGTIGTGALSGLKSVGSFIGDLPGKLATAGESLGKFGQKLGLLGFQIKSLGAQLTLAFTAPVVGLGILTTAIGLKLAASIETVTVVMTKKFGPAGAKFVVQLEKMAAASPVFDTTSILEYAQRFTAAGLNIKQTMDFLQAFSNIAQTQGVTSTDKMNLALEAFAQILSKGKVQSEELVQQLAESLPGAVQIAAEALHTTTPKLLEDLKSGKVSAKAFVKAITELGLTKKYTDPAAAAADTLAAKWSALKESFQTGLALAVIHNMDKIKKALDDVKPYVARFVKAFADHLPTAIEWLGKLFRGLDRIKQMWHDLTPGQKDFLKKLAGFAVIVGPLLVLLGTFVGIIGTLAGAFGFLLTPVGQVAIGIFAIGLAVYKFVQWIKEAASKTNAFGGFLRGVGKLFSEMGGSIKKSFLPVLDSLKGSWDDIKTAFSDPVVKEGLKDLGYIIGFVLVVAIGNLFAIFKGMVQTIGPSIQAVVDLVIGAVRTILAIIAFFGDIFTGNFDQLGQDARAIWDGLWMAIVGTLYHIGEGIVKFIGGFVTGIVDFFTWLWRILVGHSIIPDMVTAIIAWFQKLVDSVSKIAKAIGDAFMWAVNNIILPAVDKVKSAWQGALEFIKGIPDKIKGFFSGAISWLYNIGSDIVNGLVNGVKAKASFFRQALIDLLPDALKKFAGELGIGSPSKVFHQFGVWTVQGFNQGIRAEAPTTGTAMSRWASSITKAGAYNASPAGAMPYGTSSGSPKAAINIENYNVSENESASKTAERLYFLMTARGASV
jgi:tape measure domain-containing protein